jgi:hypothetical protein
MKELRIEHKKNEHLIFGKTNPIRADEGSIKARLLAFSSKNEPAPSSASFVIAEGRLSYRMWLADRSI